MDDPQVQAACIKVAGDWAIQIAVWTLEHPNPKKPAPYGLAMLQKHFQKSYQFLTQTVQK
jgi:hypothetical protein